MKFWFFILLIISVGCTAIKVQPTVTDTFTVYTEVVRDSFITLPVDSSIIEAWFECDSLNQVIMTELVQVEGSKIIPAVEFEKGRLTMVAKIDSQQVYWEWKERHDTTIYIQTIIKKVPVEVLKYKTPQWLLWLSGLGAGAIVLLIFSIILKIK